MCGIVAKICSEGHNIVGDVIEGLKQVSYRGYDSWGIGTSKGVLKRLGDVGNMREAYQPDNICIGHTRWATHGEISIENTHPISSQNGRFLVVHNGIIENCQRLTYFLEQQMYVFQSETDTEVIANYIDYLSNLLSESCLLERHVNATGQNLDGNNAFIVLDKISKKIFAYRSGNTPLYINEDWTTISSDPVVFDDESFSLIPENTVIELTHPNQRTLLSHLLTWVFPEPKKEVRQQEVEWEMLNEIYEQSEMVAKCPGWWKNLSPYTGADYSDEIILFGCGSSLNAALMGKRFIESDGVRCTVVHSMDVPNLDLTIYDNALWVGISQSGETKDTLDAAKWLVNNKQNIHCITNSSYNSLAIICGSNHNLMCGQEKAVAATKTFFQTISTLFALMFDLGLSIFEEEILEIDCQVARMAKQYKDYQHCLVLSDPYSFPIASEGALKLKEVSNIHAEALYSAEVKHGPISLVDDKVLSIFLVSAYDKPEIFNNISQIQARGGKVLVIGYPLSIDKIENADKIYISETTDNVFLGFLLALQFLSYYLAIAKSLNPDRPKNIAKAVTV